MTLRNLGIVALLLATTACGAGMRNNPCADGTFNQRECKHSMSYRGNSYVQGDQYLVSPVRAGSLVGKAFNDPYVSMGIGTGEQRLCVSLYGSDRGFNVEAAAFNRLMGEYLTAVAPGADESEIRRSMYHGLEPVWMDSEDALAESTVHGCLNLNAPLLSARVRNGVRKDVMNP